MFICCLRESCGSKAPAFRHYYFFVKAVSFIGSYSLKSQVYKFMLIKYNTEGLMDIERKIKVKV